MRTYTLTIVSVLLLGILSSCTSPQKLVERGDYEDAIETALRRLAGKKKKKAKLVLALEEAFAKANQRDLAAANRLKNQGRAENWPRIHRHYEDIRQRQEAVAPLLPLVSKEGVKANFRFVKVDELEYEARQNAAEFHYIEAKRLLLEAERGDKLAAREAYSELESTRTYFERYKEREALQQKAHALGQTKVLVKLENQSPTILPRPLQRDIEAIGVQDLNSFWKAYYTSSARETDFDYEVVMRITNVEVDPGLVKQREFEEYKEVQDGTEYILDEAGNIAVDSLGNQLTQPRYIRVGALVIEQYQTKSAFIGGRLEFYDKRNNNLIDSRPLNAEAVFENYAATFQGDKRALSEQTRQRIGNRPQPFPSEEALLFEAAEQLKPFIKQQIAGARRMI
jgi:hypothetical protein